MIRTFSDNSFSGELDELSLEDSYQHEHARAQMETPQSLLNELEVEESLTDKVGIKFELLKRNFMRSTSSIAAKPTNAVADIKTELSDIVPADVYEIVLSRINAVEQLKAFLAKLEVSVAQFIESLYLQSNICSDIASLMSGPDLGEDSGKFLAMNERINSEIRSCLFTAYKNLKDFITLTRETQVLEVNEIIKSEERLRVQLLHYKSKIKSLKAKIASCQTRSETGSQFASNFNGFISKLGVKKNTNEVENLSNELGSNEQVYTDLVDRYCTLVRTKFSKHTKSFELHVKKGLDKHYAAVHTAYQDYASSILCQ
jgi:hypothetical protein